MSIGGANCHGTSKERGSIMLIAILICIIVSVVLRIIVDNFTCADTDEWALVNFILVVVWLMVFVYTIMMALGTGAMSVWWFLWFVD